MRDQLALSFRLDVQPLNVVALIANLLHLLEQTEIANARRRGRLATDGHATDGRAATSARVAPLPRRHRVGEEQLSIPRECSQVIQHLALATGELVQRNFATGPEQQRLRQRVRQHRSRLRLIASREQPQRVVRHLDDPLTARR